MADYVPACQTCPSFGQLPVELGDDIQLEPLGACLPEFKQPDTFNSQILQIINNSKLPLDLVYNNVCISRAKATYHAISQSQILSVLEYHNLAHFVSTGKLTESVNY